jgi:cytochrome c oxidase assembly protein subunit 15
VGASASIQEAQIQMPTGPVTFTKAWIEMIHRYLAMMVGGLILVSALHAWWQRMRGDKTSSVALPTLILVWVCVQGAFGALTVTMKLFPLIVTLHLMGGLTLLGLLTFQVQRHRVMGLAENMASVKPFAWWLTLGGLALLVMQVSLGGWVSTNYAVLACNTFPMCQNSWWPLMNFEQGFTLWRHLGMDANGQPVVFESLTAIHYVHRLASYVVLAYLAWLALALRRVRAMNTLSNGLLACLVVQLMTGLSNVLLDWPLASAVMHTGGAAALVVILMWILSGSRASRSTVLN